MCFRNSTVFRVHFLMKCTANLINVVLILHQPTFSVPFHTCWFVTLLHVLVVGSYSLAAMGKITLLHITILLACLCQLWPIGTSRSFVVSSCPALAWRDGRWVLLAKCCCAKCCSTKSGKEGTHSWAPSIACKTSCFEPNIPVGAVLSTNPVLLNIVCKSRRR